MTIETLSSIKIKLLERKLDNLVNKKEEPIKNVKLKGKERIFKNKLKRIKNNNNNSNYGIQKN